MPAGRLSEGRVIHTMGYPLADATTFGGGSSTACRTTPCRVGLVDGLDYRDPTIDPHGYLPELQDAPVRPRAARGRQAWCATAPRRFPRAAGHAMPRRRDRRRCSCGDTGGFLNGVRLKGIHLAIKSGMLAAETLFDCRPRERRSRARGSTRTRRASTAVVVGAPSCGRVRNFHQAFEQAACSAA